MGFHGFGGKTRFAQSFWCVFTARRTWHEIAAARAGRLADLHGSADVKRWSMSSERPATEANPSLSFFRHQGIYCVSPSSRPHKALTVWPGKLPKATARAQE